MATGKESDFVVLAHNHNKNIPSNLYLVAGDPVLELQVQTINNIAVQELPPESWKNVHSWVHDLIDNIVKTKFENRPTLCIIDCNPSFASYTEQALLAAERLIIPCSPDGSSARAIDNVARLVYGIKTPDMYKSVGFHSKTEQFKMRIPQFHMMLLNRSTTYDKNPSKAFQSMANQIEGQVKSFKRELSNKQYTATNDINHMPDAHTASVVATSRGEPFFQLKPKPYELSDGTSPALNSEQFVPYKAKLDGIVSLL